MSQLEIRPAARSDLPALRDMQERSLRVLGRGAYSAIQIEAFIARIGTMDDYLIQDCTYLVAQLEGEILGCGGWTTRLPGYARHARNEMQPVDPGRATIRSIFVEPLAARQGIGRQVMNAVENAMRGEGFRSAELGATDCGLGFYRRLGFRPVKEFTVGLGDGIDMHFTRMQKVLAPANSDAAALRSLTA
jgi:GNAT superfamily N-acetyltransferase